MTAAAAFTPALEAARVEALVAAVRARGIDGPLWLLCPHEGRRGALLDRLARAGGGWIQPLDWDGLLDLIEQRLGLASRPRLPPVDRVLVVEAALDVAAAHDPALASAMRGGALAVAHAVADAVDALRLHGWDGTVPAHADAGVAGRHLAMLSGVTRALDHHLSTTGCADLARRLASLADATPRPALRGVAVWVEGVDRLAPAERRALALAAASGAAVSLPPWIDAPEHVADPSSAADTLLDALRTGAAVASHDDGSLAYRSPSDPFDEAETVASLIESHLAAGGSAEDVAVVCGPEPGAWPRVARALDRWGIPWNGGGSLPVQQTPLWQIVRASLRLAWNGPDAIDLATVLAAPGSGIFGTDRDYFLSKLRRQLPAAWSDVRTLLDEATAVDDPEATGTDDAAVRRARGEQIRKRVGSFLKAWEEAGPLRRRTADERADLLPAVFDRAVTPLLDAEAVARSVRDPRALAAWLGAAEAIRAALDLVRRRLASDAHRTRRLSDVERLLTDIEASFPTLRDGAPSPRRDGVALVGEDAWGCERPAMLVVTGFLRGRFPRTPGPLLLLGPAERALLATLSPDLAALPDDATLHALARRATLRLLSAPSRRLVLLAPHRASDGHRAEASLALRDLLDRLPEGAAIAPPSHAADAPRSRAAAAVHALGRRDVETAVDAARALAHADVAWRDLFAARFLPDASFEVGDVARPLVRSREHDASDLESLLTCHYRYLMTSLLDLRSAPPRRQARVGESVRQKVGRAVIDALDVELAAGPRVGLAKVAETVREAMRQHAPPDGHDVHARLFDDAHALGVQYLDLRRTLGACSVEAAPETPAPRALLPLADGAALTVRPPSVPTLRVVVPGGEVAPVLVQLTRHRTKSLAQRRDAGLDADAALLAAVPPEGAGVVLRLNLGNNLVDAVGARTSPAAVVLDAVTGDRVLRDQRTLDDHVAASTARIADALSAVDAPGGRFVPLDRDRARDLDRIRALPCSRCDARLGCRTGLPGGTT